MKSRTARLAMVLALSFLFGSTFVAASQDPPATPAPPKVRKKTTRKSAMRGIPAGVTKCLDHLTEMASTDPLTPYAGHPAEIINDGLLWEKSRCPIGSDQSLRLKVHEMSKAWQEKNADRVKTLLGEIRSAAPAN